MVSLSMISDCSSNCNCGSVKVLFEVLEISNNCKLGLHMQNHSKVAQD